MSDASTIAAEMTQTVRLRRLFERIHVTSARITIPKPDAQMPPRDPVMINAAEIMKTKSTLIKFGEDVEGYAIPVLNEREIRASAGILFVFMLISLMLILFKGNFLLICLCNNHLQSSGRAETCRR